ncbi:kinase-like domain-containing protein [Amylocystis lapponica]|nr:kinase-like domain-containing protein [Amylocystis lapponica]
MFLFATASVPFRIVVVLSLCIVPLALVSQHRSGAITNWLTPCSQRRPLWLNSASMNSENAADGMLSDNELFWRAHQPWLQGKGYMLRPRYKPDWKPSWVQGEIPQHEAEDALGMRYFPNIMDAFRVADGKMVMLKKISKSQHPFEVDINQSLSLPPLSSDPHNHCVPIYDVLTSPDDADILLLVMPLLTSFNDPEIQTIGEAFDFVHQLFQGLQFLHGQHVAYRGISSLNIMLDTSDMLPEMYHPKAPTETGGCKDTHAVKSYTRTERPPKYYYVDFEHARKYNFDDGLPREVPYVGGDSSAPEFQGNGAKQPHDPFPTDVYYVGRLVKEDLIQKYKGLESLERLVADMLQADPQRRPTIDEVITQFDEIQRAQSSILFRIRLVGKQDSMRTRINLEMRHLKRQLDYTVRGLSAIPDHTRSRS